MSLTLYNQSRQPIVKGGSYEKSPLADVFLEAAGGRIDIQHAVTAVFRYCFDFGVDPYSISVTKYSITASFSRGPIANIFITQYSVTVNFFNS